MKFESISMQNKECRKVFDKIGAFLDVIYTEDIKALKPKFRQDYHKLYSFCTSYHAVMNQLWVYTEYKEDAIVKMQLEIDAFMVTYKELFGKDVTNYFHYLDSGHMTYYLRKYKGNIMQFSNQGWEGLNAWVKMIIKTKTQRGGACGTVTQAMRKRSEDAILDFCLRRLVWTFGYSDEELREMIDSNENDSTSNET